MTDPSTLFTSEKGGRLLMRIARIGVAILFPVLARDRERRRRWSAVTEVTALRQGPIPHVSRCGTG
jgi:hypothetical protein